MVTGQAIYAMYEPDIVCYDPIYIYLAITVMFYINA